MLQLLVSVYYTFVRNYLWYFPYLKVLSLFLRVFLNLIAILHIYYFILFNLREGWGSIQMPYYSMWGTDKGAFAYLYIIIIWNDFKKGENLHYKKFCVVVFKIRVPGYNFIILSKFIASCRFCRVAKRVK